MDYNHEGILSAEDSQTTIDDLPNEILAHIFSKGAGLRKNNQSYPSFPLLVLAVNSHWRLVAQSTPELWTLIVPPLHKGVQACLDYTTTYLQISGALLLSVVLDGRLGRTDALDPNSATLSIPEVFTLLVKMENVTRLRRLDIWAHDSLSLQNAPLHLLQRASCLQQFSLVYDEERTTFAISSIDHGTAWEWLAGSQTIRKLRWSTGTDTPIVPNLTTLSAQNLSVTYEDVRTLFETCPSLAHLVLDGIQPMVVGPTRAGYRSIQVDSLRSIALRCNRIVRPGVTYIFHVLIIPNLAYLELDGTLSVSLLFGTSLSSTRVETLRIANYAQGNFPHSNSQQDRDDLAILRSFSDLRHLQFVHAPTCNLLSRLSDAHRFSDAYARTRTQSINSARRGDRPRHGAPPIRKYDPFPPPENFVTETEDLQLLPWRKLHTISLDILSAADLQYVCNLLVLQKSIKRVELSPPTMRHLSDSLRRNGNMIYAIPWRASQSPIIDNNARGASKDVKEWLAMQVDLRSMEVSDYGLLGGGRVPLSELP